MLKRLRTLLGIAVVVALATTGCGGDADDSDAAEPGETTTTVSNAPKDERVDRRLVVSVTGTAEASVDAVVPMRFVTRVGEGEVANFNLAHVGFQSPVELDPERTLDIEVGLVGLYQGDGTYALPAGIGQAPTTGPTAPKPNGTGALSVVGVRIVRPGPPATEEYFAHPLEPCEVVLRRDASEGEVTCPKVLSIRGEAVRFEMRWGPAT